MSAFIGVVLGLFLIPGPAVLLSAAYTTLLALAIRPIGRVGGRIGWLRRWQGRIIGSIFIGLGLRVAVQQRG